MDTFKFNVKRLDGNGKTIESDYLTSSGNFYMNSDKELVTSQGYNVLNDADDKIINLPVQILHINRQWSNY